MTWLARLSLRNRAVVGLVTALLLVFGVVSTTSLRQELFPNIDVPVASVVTPYQGASPEVVEEQVTTPIERAVGRLDGVTGSRSSSTSGSSVVTLDLDYGVNLDDLTTRLQRELAGVPLPQGVTPQVLTGGTGGIPVVQLAVSSNLGPERVAQILRTDVQPYLAGLAGVLEVTLSGTAERQVVIDVDPAAAAARGVSLSAISAVLQANGVRVPAGQLSPDATPLDVEVGSPLTSVEQVADLYVTPGAAPAGGTARGGGAPAGSAGAQPGGSAGAAGPAPGAAADGAPVRLGDIAEVRSQPAPATGYSRTNGVPSIGISVTKLPEANTVSVSEEVRAALGRISDSLGGTAQNAQVSVVFDQAPYIQQSIDDLVTEGGLGLLFAILVILAFLLSVRATLVTAVSIPLSVLIALIVLDVGGYTLNILTLGALTVAIGRVVDDSIVVIENIKRHVGSGRASPPVVVAAVREVAGAITASTVTTVAVFAPIGFVGGQVGELFRPFAVTVTAALLASLLVSLTVVPVLASVVLHGRRRRKTTAEPAAAQAVAEPAPHRDTRDVLQRGYLPVLRGAVRRPVVSLLVALLVLGGTAALVPLLTTNFLGDAGGNTVMVTQRLPAGTGLPQTDAQAKRVEEVLAGTPGVGSYQATVGTTGSRFGPGGGTGVSTSRFSITLADDADRAAVEEDLRGRLAALGDAAGQVAVGGPGGVGNDNLQVDVRAEDPQVLADAAGQVERAVAGMTGVADVRNDLAADQPVVQVAVDRQKAAAAGLTETQIGQSVAAALRGSTLGAVTIDGTEQNVLLRAGEAPADIAALRDLLLAGVRGQVRLSQVATVTQARTTPMITHVDGSRSASITARPTGDDVGATSATLRTTLAGLTLPAGATAEIAGVSVQQEEAFRQLGLALLAAVAVVYLVMVVTFGSLVQPLILLVSVPFAATGAIGLLVLTGTPLGVPALIGMLMLVGIVVTNAIVLIDLVNQYRRAGRGVHEAVVEGAAQRLRPILMTAVATICALVPMSLGLTGGGVFISQPLAIVVIGGLVSSTLLTLVLVPVLYVLVERLRGRRGGGGEAGPGDDHGPAAEAAARGAWSQPAEPDAGGPVAAGAALALAGARAAASNGHGRHGAATDPTPAVSPPAGPGGGADVTGPDRAGATVPTGGAVGGAALEDGPTLLLSAARHAAPPPPALPDGPGLHGIVADHEGEPVAEASVDVFDGAGRRLGGGATDVLGRYALAVPGAGEYLVVAHSGGRQPVAEWVTVAADAPVRHDARVEGPATVSGCVRAADGTGVAALVSVVDAAGATLASTRADAGGFYRLPHVPEGRHRLLVAPPGAASTVRPLDVPASGHVGSDVALPPTGVLTGTLRSDQGFALPGVLADVVDADGVVVATTRTAADGSFRLDGLPPGTYTVTAHPGLPAQRQVLVEADRVTRTELALPPRPLR